MMQFPKATVKIGSCVAMVSTHYTHRGKPYTDNRYPIVTVDGEWWQAHRLSFSLNVKRIPRRPCERKGIWKHKMVLHRCNHKWCIRPKHLYLGMHKQNSTDMWKFMSSKTRARHRKLMNALCSQPAYRRRMSERLKGRKFTPTHIKHMSQAQRRRHK